MPSSGPGSPCRVQTTAGVISAHNVILATGTPILDRGLYFAKLKPQRSYALAFEVPAMKATDMYLSVDAPTRSIRTTPTAAGELLLVGGNGHETGRAPSPRHLIDDLIAWTKVHYNGAEPTIRGPRRITPPTTSCRLSARCRADRGTSMWRPVMASGA